MSVLTAAEASEDGKIAVHVIYPDGTKNCRQLPLMDDDGSDVSISDIKKMLIPNNPDDYTLVLVKLPGRFIAADTDFITDYYDQLFGEKYTIMFEPRN
ncbi:hypothetical protein Btru_062904 [Bulinus truncatus]|nr:hypothetical protein Btru_062904 [Bulinus truncatus]